MSPTVQVTREAGSNPEVLIDGKPASRVACGTDSTRTMWLSECEKYLVKVDPPHFTQAHIEAMIWDELEDEDKGFFTPVLDSQTDTDVGPCWVLTNYVPDMEDVSYSTTPAGMLDAAHDLFDKYDISDYGVRQWKVVGDSFIIHDYGVSPRRASNEY